VTFEVYPDMPGVQWDGEIAATERRRVAWFRDSEGNFMCIDEAKERA